MARQGKWGLTEISVLVEVYSAYSTRDTALLRRYRWSHSCKYADAMLPRIRGDELTGEY